MKERAHQIGADDSGNYNSWWALPTCKCTTLEKWRWKIKGTGIHINRTREIKEMIIIQNKDTDEREML